MPKVNKIEIHNKKENAEKMHSITKLGLQKVFNFHIMGSMCSLHNYAFTLPDGNKATKLKHSPINN